MYSAGLVTFLEKSFKELETLVFSLSCLGSKGSSFIDNNSQQEELLRRVPITPVSS